MDHSAPLTGVADRCLWWSALPPRAGVAGELPPRADVAIVGGGYTGLSAARALARLGTDVVLLEREWLGWGASSRNGGMVLPGYKADLLAMVRRLGQEQARQLFADSLEAIAFVETLVRDEQIACDWSRSGHVTLAARPAHLRELVRHQRLLARDFGHATQLLGPAELRSELGSERYHGGLLDETAGALQPAAYLAGLAGAARRAGARLVEGIEVRRLTTGRNGVTLRTTAGDLTAREVLIATNGYTGALTPWLARRLVPVGSFLVATVPLGVELALRLSPRGRMLSDTKRLLYYFRLSPDGRMVFGGRAAFVPTALARSLELLRSGMIEVFPELASVPIEYGWGGRLGFTRDLLPHAGRHGGVSYAVGYGGHGVAYASWLGDRVGKALAGKEPWPAISDVSFPAVPLYAGRPWFLPIVGAWSRVLDGWS